MGKKKKTVEKKKKKGRPSLLDLQKRNLRQIQQRQQQHQHHHHHKQNRSPNPNFRNPSPNLRNPSSAAVRRSTRRNPFPDADRTDDEEGDEFDGKRREKKLKVVLRLPPPPPPRSSSGNSRGGGTDEESYGSVDLDRETPRKKRKINAVSAGDGGFAAGSEGEKAERHNSGSKGTEALHGTPPDSGPGTPLPDKKLLAFILDRLQKKDTYGVFSEPVDPNELPDYHEIIEHPMDFSTVRKKLSSRAYANLEQFEKDVFLISSNAMHYNAPDTIYFRQARSIQELAKKDFENLRQDRQENEPEMKTVRRGRPPGKSSIKKAGRLPTEHAGSDFSSDATPANAGDNTIWFNSTHELSRKRQLSNRPSTADIFAKTSSHNGENYAGLSEHKSDRKDEFPGSVLKGISKFGRKPFVFDENRRGTYRLSQQSLAGCEPSMLTTFKGEKRHLMAVGVHIEHAYMRSLARFAANLGPIAFKVASKKIEKALPRGMKFGPGWLGENEGPQKQFPMLSTSRQQPLPASQSPSQPKSSSHLMPHAVGSDGAELSVKQEPSTDPPLESHSNRDLLASTATSAVANRSSGPTEGAETARGINYGSGLSLVGTGGGLGPKHSFQPSQNPAIHSPINGFKSGYALNRSQHVGKLVGVGPPRSVGNFVSEASTPSRLINMVSRSSSSSSSYCIQQMPMNRSEAEDANVLGNSSSINRILDSCPEGQTGTGGGLHSQPSWQGKSDSVPPDLNVIFQSTGSPTSAVSKQPDLALQL